MQAKLKKEPQVEGKSPREVAEQLLEQLVTKNPRLKAARKRAQLEEDGELKIGDEMVQIYRQHLKG